MSNHQRLARSRGWRWLLVSVAALSLLGLMPGAAQSDEGPILVLAPSGATATIPTSTGLDVASLVPAPVELSTPALCGDIAVFDQEDVGTLCNPAALAATPITSPTCPQVVSGSVRLETDLLCTDTDGLIVGSDNTIIDLNGHRILCTGEAGGYMGSCQGPGLAGDLADYGIEIAGRDNVHVFSHREGGTVEGFDIGVFVHSNSDNVKVKQLIVTGPAGTAGNPRPGNTYGILVFNTLVCQGANVRIGGGTKTGNDISHHRLGIAAVDANCLYIGANTVHEIRDHGNAAFRALGILLQRVSDSHVRSNIATENGDNETAVIPDSGIILDAFPVPAGVTTNNLVVENEANGNRGAGISMTRGASGNDIVNNQMLGNSFFDAYSDQTGVNDWNENNRCQTQTTPQPPPGVCNPGEVPPPQ